MDPTRPLSRLLLGRGAGFPWGTLILLLGCVLTSAPLFVRPGLYLVIGAGNETGDNLHLQPWHAVVTTFVHGGGFPGLPAHLAINAAFLLVLGGLLERALGTGRFFALSGACLAAGFAVRIALHRYAHGISNVVWSYADFAPLLLAHAWRSAGLRALRDPVVLGGLLLLAIAVLGVVVPWHLLSALVGLPFALAYRGVLRSNCERLARGEAPDVLGPGARTASLAVLGSLALFSVAVTGAALAGALG